MSTSTPRSHTVPWSWSVRPVSDALVVLLAAMLVQALLHHRHDLPAHVLAGGGLGLVLAAAAPARSARWVAVAIVVAALVAGEVAEVLVFGPPDHADVAMTMAGALLVCDAAGEVAAGDVGLRARSVQIGALLGLAGLVLRYTT